jgi:hydrogenase expression/formation protein HypD
MCISGLVLQGLKKPHQCPAFGTTCTPENPLGATMVSSEGACAAYYNYGRLRKSAEALSLNLEIPAHV